MMETAGVLPPVDRRQLALEEILGKIAPQVLTLMNVACSAKDIGALWNEMGALHRRTEEMAALFASEPDIQKNVLAIGQLGGGAVSIGPRGVPLQLFERFSEAREALNRVLAEMQAEGAKGSGVQAVSRDEAREPAAIAELPTHEMEKANVFRREGEYWTIGYEGKVIRLRGTKGLNYIAQLLAHPERDFHVFDLIAAYERHEADFLTKTCEGMSKEELEEQHGLTKSAPGSAGVTIDTTASAAYRSRLADLYEELKEAIEFNDIGRSDAIKAEIDQIEDTLDTGYGRYGKARAVHDPVERARKSVTNRVNDSLKKIKAEHPSLWKHLRKSINKGKAFSYWPGTPTIWET